MVQRQGSLHPTGPHPWDPHPVGDTPLTVTRWYYAKVVALAEEGYFVTFLGYGNTAQVA